MKNQVYKLHENEIEKYYYELVMDTEYLDIHEDISTQNEKFYLHNHTFYEMIYCRSGDLQYYLDGKIYHIQKNTIVVNPPGVIHGPLFFNQCDEPYHRFVLWLSPELYRQWLDELYKVEPNARVIAEHPSYVLRFEGNILTQIRQNIDMILQEKKQNLPGNELFCKGALYQLLCLLYRGRVYTSASLVESEHNELLNDILNYIDEHLSEKLSLKSIAGKFLISQSSVSQLFKKHLGISFYSFIIEKRLNEAKILITRAVPLKEIPELCGFSDYSSFYKAFMKKYGISPKVYRQNLLEREPGKSSSESPADKAETAPNAPEAG